MYERFFGLTKAPFSIVPDPDCLHLTKQHADAISGLAFGVLERKGYLVITAEAGLGKTTALRVLSNLLQESRIATSVIVAPTLTPSEFLEMAMLNFGFKDIPASKAQRLKKLEEFLVKLDAQDRTAALIVDEAHQLSADLLEEIRLLGNLESAERKLLQIVLGGQEDLDDHLNLPELWQLKQRITVRVSLRPLHRDSTAEYIHFRWMRAGGAEPVPFTIEAIDAIANWSRGVPRLINVICDNALLVAFSETTRKIDLEFVREACHELAIASPPVTRALGDATTEALSGGEASILSLIDQVPASEDATVANDPERGFVWKRWRDSKRRRSRSRTGFLLLKEP